MMIDRGSKIRVPIKIAYFLIKNMILALGKIIVWFMVKIFRGRKIIRIKQFIGKIIMG